MRKIIIFVISVSMVSLSFCTSSPVSNTYDAQAVTIKDYPDGDVVSNPFTFHDPETTAGDFEIETSAPESTSETAGYEITTTSGNEAETTTVSGTDTETTAVSGTDTETTAVSGTDTETTTVSGSGSETSSSSEYTTETPSTPASSTEPVTTAPSKKSGFNKNGYYKDLKSGAVYKLVNKSKKTVKYTGNTKKNLKKAVIPTNIKVAGVTYKVTIIGKKALSSKKSLKNIVIGKNVKSIESLAFSKNKKLKTVIIHSKGMIKATKDILKKSNKNAVIKVPKKYLKKYRKLFKNNTVIKK